MNSQENKKQSFLKKRLSQPSTYFGIGGIVFGCIYYQDINNLIHEILRNSQLDDMIVNNLNPVFNTLISSLCTYLVFFKGKK